MSDQKIINKSMELSDLTTPESKKIITELSVLIKNIKDKGLKISSWAGAFDLKGEENCEEVLNRGFNYKAVEGAADDINFPWFLYWEIAWVVHHAGFEKGHNILDLGGSSSLFSFYLASKGYDVTTIDLNNKLVDNANHVAAKMGWQLNNHVMDMNDLKIKIKFDHITSICVFEHIPYFSRIEINKTIKKMLKPGGKFSITFDYKSPSRLARISTPADVFEQFVQPSGLNIRDNQTFQDTGTNYLLSPFYHPRTSLKYKLRHILLGHFRIWELLKVKKENDYSFGALFQENTINP